MLLGPNLLRLNQIHLSFRDEIIDCSQIFNVFVGQKFRLDGGFAFPDISGNVVDVWHSVAESDPGSVQIQDSPLRLDSVGRQERLDGFGHVDRRGRQPRRHLLD